MKLRTVSTLPFALLALLVVAGCDANNAPPSNSDGGTNTMCTNGNVSCGQLCEGDSRPAICNVDCSDGQTCATGSYCGPGGTCTLDCTDSSTCMGGVCSTVTGRCVIPPDVGPVQDFGPPPDFGPQGDGGVCARVSVDVDRVTPNVIFIVDESGSMGWELNTSDGIQCPVNSQGNPDCYDSSTASIRALSRWEGMRSTLFGTTAGPADEGLIFDLGDRVSFGMVTYWGSSNSDASCPRSRTLTQSPVFDATPVTVVAAGTTPTARDVMAGDGPSSDDGKFFDINPGGFTPTGPALDFTRTNLASSITSSDDPTIFILVTDGLPNNDAPACDDSSIPNYRSNALQWSEEAVQRAFSAGIRTFVLAVADESDLPATHVNRLANAGVGASLSASPAAESWRIGSVTALESALNGIIGAEISCELALNGTAPGWETDRCSGGSIDLVEGGTRMSIPCDGTNGWQLTSDTTVEIFGTWCDTLKATGTATIDATFPCDTIILPG